LASAAVESLTAMECWPREFGGDGDGTDDRKGSSRIVPHRLTEGQQRILLTCNQPEFAALTPGQIMPVLADRGRLYRPLPEPDSINLSRSL
jgi:hypothetical protein